jgi:hypothetical protein
MNEDNHRTSLLPFPPHYRTLGVFLHAQGEGAKGFIASWNELMDVISSNSPNLPKAG